VWKNVKTFNFNMLQLSLFHKIWNISFAKLAQHQLKVTQMSCTFLPVNLGRPFLLVFIVYPGLYLSFQCGMGIILIFPYRNIWKTILEDNLEVIFRNGKLEESGSSLSWPWYRIQVQNELYIFLLLFFLVYSLRINSRLWLAGHSQEIMT
jgi:hypothetical protein